MKKILLSTIIVITTVFTTIAQGWQPVGTISFPGGWMVFPSLVFSPEGEPYVAYSDYSDNSGKTTVAKFDGANWVIVGSPRFSAGEVREKSLAFSPTGEPYVAYSDYIKESIYTYKAIVKKFNGTDWVNVGAAGFSAGTADFSPTSLAFSPTGEPYVAYSDRAQPRGGATVMKFDGTNWVNVGAAGFSAGGGGFTSLAFSPTGEPYVAYQGNSAKATVMKFDGTNWVNVGAAGFSANWAYYISLVFSPTGEPYVAYSDYINYGSLRKATVMKFNGTNWVNVGSPGFSTDYGAEYVSFAFSPSGAPYVAYWNAGANSHDNGSAVMRFDGTNWVNVGNLGFSPHDAGDAAFSLAFSPAGEPYVVCVREDSAVMKFAPTTYTVTTSADPSIGGTVSGGGSHHEGASVTLTATPNANYQFVKWIENGADISTTNPYTFTINGNRTLVAEFELGTGIAGLYTDKNAIAVYPNPTNNMINFSVSTNVQLTNITGQTVASKTNVNTLDITGQPAGIYFVTLTNYKGQVLQRSKIVKE